MATISTRLKFRIGLRSVGLSMTAAEFDARPERASNPNYRYELIRGVPIVSPPAGIGDRSPNEELGHLTWFHRQTHPQGRSIDGSVFEQTLPGGENRRRRDRAIWAGLGRTPNPEVDFPAIVVEFVSGSRRDFLRDYAEKRDEYLQAGALEYWIIDRFRRIMTSYQLAREEGQVGAVVTIAADGSYLTDLLPGFVLPLGRLLQAADDWAPPARPKRRPRPQPPEGDPR